jgi:predicted phosphodiesterase
MRLAVIADIHGNVPALEAVLADIKCRGADLTVDLGDCVSGPLWPRETMDLLETLGLPTVRGNHERQLQLPRAEQGLSDGYTSDHLTPTQLAHLGGLPLTRAPLDGVLMFHGTPTRDDAPLLDQPLPDGGFALATRADIATRITDLTCELALCGHTHQPRVVQMAAKSGRPMLIVNPGSVGLPGFEDGGRYFNSGTPHARYAVLTRTAGVWAVDLIALEYDWARAATQAMANARPDWASGLATGFAEPKD